MARNKSGAFNRLLNFIGLVDDGDSRDTYGEEYQNGNYGRQQAYTPARPQRSSSASSSRSSSRQSTQRRSLPGVRLRSFSFAMILSVPSSVFYPSQGSPVCRAMISTSLFAACSVSASAKIRTRGSVPEKRTMTHPPSR